MQVNYKKQLVLEKIISPTLSQPSFKFQTQLKASAGYPQLSIVLTTISMWAALSDEICDNILKEVKTPQ